MEEKVSDLFVQAFLSSYSNTAADALLQSQVGRKYDKLELIRHCHASNGKQSPIHIKQSFKFLYHFPPGIDSIPCNEILSHGFTGTGVCALLNGPPSLESSIRQPNSKVQALQAYYDTEAAPQIKVAWRH